MRKFIIFLFTLLFTLVPVVFFWKSSEVFEFNKMVVVYLFTVLLTTVWIGRMVIEQRIIFRRTLLDIPLLLFLLSQIVSTFISIDPHTSIFGYYSRFHGGLLSTISYLLLYWNFVSNFDRKAVNQIIDFLLYSGVVVAIWAGMEHFYHSPSCLLINNEFNVACWTQYENGPIRIFGTMGQPNWLAAYLVAISPLAWQKLKEIKETKYQLIWGGILVIFFSVLLFTKSRSGILAFGAIWLVFHLYPIFSNFVLKKKTKIQDFKSNLIINFLIVVIILVFGTPWTPNIFDQIRKIQPVETKLQSETVLDTGGTESGEIRKIVWEGAFNLWRKYPLLGTGVETFAYSYYETRPPAHNLTSEWDHLYNKAHNEYLNFLATTGIFGFAAYSLVIVLALLQLTNLKGIKLKEIAKIKTEKLVLVLAYGSILITNFFGFSVVATGLLFFLLPALAKALEDENTAEIQVKTLNTNQTFFLLILFLISGYLLLTIGRYWQADYLYAKSKNYSKSTFQKNFDHIEKAISLSPNEPNYHDQLATLYATYAVALHEAGYADDAKEFAKLAANESDYTLSLSPRHILLQRSRANLLTDLGGIDSAYLIKANQMWEYIVKYSPTDAKAYYKAALSYYRIGLNSKAKEYLEYTLKLKPNYNDALRDIEKL